MKKREIQKREIQLGLGFAQRNFLTGEWENVGGPTPEMIERISVNRENPLMNIAKFYSKQPNPQKYRDFLAEAKRRGIPQDLSAWTRTKKEILEKYFPGQFSKQDLNKYCDREIGGIYLKLIKYAESNQQ